MKAQIGKVRVAYKKNDPSGLMTSTSKNKRTLDETKVIHVTPISIVMSTTSNETKASTRQRNTRLIWGNPILIWQKMPL